MRSKNRDLPREPEAGSGRGLSRQTWDVLVAHGDLDGLEILEPPPSEAVTEGSADDDELDLRIPALDQLADHLERHDRLDEAEHVLLRRLALVEQPAGVSPSPDSLLTALQDLGQFYGRTGRLGEAELSFRQALTVAERSSKPGVRAGILHNLAVLYEGAGRSDEANALWAQARSLLEPKH